jgi:hypothetical protein
MRAIAFLYQHQRELKTTDVDGEPLEFIEVTLEDIAKANKLANEVLGQSLDELAKPSRTLLGGIYTMVQEMAEKQKLLLSDIFFNRRQVREYMGWSDWQIRAHIGQLEDLEYIRVRLGAMGKEYAYVLNYLGQAEDGQEKHFLNLTPVEEIKRLMDKDDKDKE